MPITEQIEMLLEAFPEKQSKGIHGKYYPSLKERSSSIEAHGTIRFASSAAQPAPKHKQRRLLPYTSLAAVFSTPLTTKSRTGSRSREQTRGNDHVSENAEKKPQSTMTQKRFWACGVTVSPGQAARWSAPQDSSEPGHVMLLVIRELNRLLQVNGFTDQKLQPLFLTVSVLKTCSRFHALDKRCDKRICGDFISGAVLRRC